MPYTLADVVGCCQDWFYGRSQTPSSPSPKSLQGQINALKARVTALEQNQIKPSDLQVGISSLKAHTDPVASSLDSAPH